VELHCADSMMNTVIDQFGEKVKTEPAPDGGFRLWAEVSLSPPFFAWVFEFGGKIRIVSPQSAIDAYDELSQKAAVGIE
ncbi:MAG: WYL domain-containing protein, partial [Oscillospiraceae bacterium]|nr:WYL domain-containing protein [Oscillospiraceae bacterium]